MGSCMYVCSVWHLESSFSLPSGSCPSLCPASQVVNWAQCSGLPQASARPPSPARGAGGELGRGAREAGGLCRDLGGPGGATWGEGGQG